MLIKPAYTGKKVFGNIAYYTGIFIALFFPCCVIVASLLMLAGFTFSILVPLIAFSLSIAFLFVDITKENRLMILSGVVTLFILLAAICLFLGGLYFDTSFDGQWYHEEGMIQLMKGWNPYSKGYPLGPYDAKFFIARYPQGDLFALNSIFIFFKNNIEVAKGLNFLMGICAFLLLVKAFRLLLPEGSKAQQWLLVLLSFVIVINPVTVAQLFTFYHDGRLYYETIILASLIIIHNFRSSILLKTAIILNIIFLINIKFTGLEYTGLLCGTYILFELIRKQWKIAIKFATLSLVAAILSLTIIGYGSYIKNFINSGHPLYPIMGPGNIANGIEQQLEPNNFESLSNFKKFYYSNTALPVWSRSPLNSQQRTLFKLSDVSYYESYYRPDTEMNGFGVFFAEFVLVSFIVLVLEFCVRKKILFLFFLWIIYLLVLFSIFINPLSFIARYAPEGWLLPILPILGLIVLNKSYLNVFACIFLALLSYNSYLIFRAELKSVEKQSDLVSTQLLTLRKQNQSVIVSAKWSSFTERLSEYDIKFSQVDKLYTDSIPLESSYNMAFIKK